MLTTGAMSVQKEETLGSVQTFELASKVFGNRRTIRVHLPPGYEATTNRDRRYPVLYLNDGFAVFKATAWNAPQTVSRLIADKSIESLILIGIDNGACADGGTEDQRTIEYLPYPDKKYEPTILAPRGQEYPRFLITEVMPEVTKRYRVRPGAESCGIGGASYGGLAALYTVLHNPDVFGRLLLESTPLFMGNNGVLSDSARSHRWPARVYIGIGTKETKDETLNRSPFMEGLRSTVVRESPRSRVKLLVAQGASHNSAAWRARLPEALKFLWGK
jgi:predicted alpha/beta superfamily hydrolase